MRIKHTYITVTGKVTQKEYLYNRDHIVHKKVRCPNCNIPLLIVYHNIPKTNCQRKRIGYYCKLCEYCYIYEKYTTFKIKEEVR